MFYSDVPWWLMLFLLLCIAAIYCGAGIVLGLISIGVTATILKHRETTIERHQQIIGLLIGAIAGGLLDFAVVSPIL